MHYVYVLQSQKSNKYYVGYTSRSVTERLNEHNSGKNHFALRNKPFTLVYFEEYVDKNFAMKREKFFKSGHGRKVLKNKLNCSF